jgi:uncharacterized protein (DUF1697 family)
MARPTKYVAFLRGIAPMNPNMRNEKLRSVFEDLGFGKVTSVISSGNIIFETSQQHIPALEAKIEKALHTKLGITSTTIIRSSEQLQELLDKRPFGVQQHTLTSYLIVTFLQTKPQHRLDIPDIYNVAAQYDCEVCTFLDTTDSKQTDPLRWLEKNYGKHITTRTWLTVERVMKKMHAL